MLRLVNVAAQDSSQIIFNTGEIGGGNIVYVVYDTSTGISLESQEDYLGWRTETTSTGVGTYGFIINNANKYPSYNDDVDDYTTLNPKLFRVMTLQEYTILHDVLIRFDLVRKRIPNPGVSVQGTDGVGESGVVAFSGGYEKKMTVGEVMQMMEGTIVEVNATTPRTTYWPVYSDEDSDKTYVPYLRTSGIPSDMMELVKLGTMIRCLVSMGILEVDISFSTSDSGLQLTFDRAGLYKGWADFMLKQYDEMKVLVKWNHANHAGVGIGTVPWAAYGIWGTLMNNVSYGGQLALHSVLGFTARGNVPM